MAKTPEKNLPPAASQGPAVADMARAIVDGVDAVVLAMECKWGVGRLRLLVSDDLRARFDALARDWNEAVWHGDIEAITAAGQRMHKALPALDRYATDHGAEPLRPKVIEGATPDGECFAIVMTDAEASHVIRNDRAMTVYTVEEIGRLLAGFPALAKAKDVFPGAKVTAARRPTIPFDEILGDELPEGLR